MVALLPICVAAACAVGPSRLAVTTPSVPTDAASPELSPEGAPKDAGDEESWLTEALRDVYPSVELEDEDSSASAARLATAGASSRADAGEPAAVRITVPPKQDFPLYCFTWFHIRDYSTDCFRSVRECESARPQWMHHGGPRPTKCQERHHASCTTVPSTGDERCFGSADNCIRFRNYLAKRGLETTVCRYW
jgi:hypothetical protein